MRTMRALLSTEATKLKKTATLWLSLIVPAMLLLLLFIGLVDDYFRHPIRRMPASAEAEWISVLARPWMLWAHLLPILIAVEAAGLASPEHAGKHWKQLYALPIPRWSVYVAKALMCALLTAGSSLFFSAGLVALGLARSELFHLQIASDVPLGVVLEVTARAYLASWCVIAIQTWLSVRFSGFAISIGTAVAALLFSGLAAQFGVAGLYPWTMPLDSLPWGWSEAPAPAMVSPLLCVAVAVAAGWHLSRREVV